MTNFCITELLIEVVGTIYLRIPDAIASKGVFGMYRIVSVSLLVRIHVVVGCL